jgi:hypothetical protein
MGSDATTIVFLYTTVTLSNAVNQRQEKKQKEPVEH